MATKPEPSPANVESLLSVIADKLAAMDARLGQLEGKEPKILPSRPGGPQIGEIYGQKIEVTDKLFPDRRHKFQYRDIVRLRPSSDKFARIQRNLESLLERKGTDADTEVAVVLKSMADGEGPLGEVEKYQHTSRKKGVQKYQVKFPGIGKDGCLETELELVRRPS